MAAPFVEGAECALAFFDVESFFRSMRLSLTFGDRVIPVLELEDGFRIDDVSDAEIVFEQYHGTATGMGTIQDMIAHAINRDAPTAIAWTDNETVPVSFLPAVFFTKFPVNTWRITAVSTGAEGAKDPLMTSVTIKPKYAAYVAP